MFKGVHFTKTQTVNIKKWIEEISIPLEVEKILKDKKLSPHQKGAKIYRLFYCARYPELSKYQQKFKKVADEIYRKTGARIRLANQYFESDEIIVEPKYKISEVEKLRSLIESIMNWRPILK